MSTVFAPGLEVARRFYGDVVAPLSADVTHSAALLGWGSDVLGFDTARSTDHGWGPRLQVFVDLQDVDQLDAHLEAELPERYDGWPVRFGWDETPVSKHVEVVALGSWLERRLGLDPRGGLSHGDWLTLPQQLLLEVTAGAVFHDGLGELAPLRASLAWYPDDVWLWLLAAQWRRIAQEEAFVGRAAELGDELGSRLLTARLARDIVRLCFLQEQRYAPYSKWLGSAFESLEAVATVGPALIAALTARDHVAREQALVEAYEKVAHRHNALRVTDEVDPHVRPFHSRPFRVLDSDRFVAACLARVEDAWLRTLPPFGGIDQWVDSTDVLSYPGRARRATLMYQSEEEGS